MKSIPVDQLQHKTRTGLQIKIFQPGDAGHAIKEAAHRNDHYIFFLLTAGSGTLKVDLEDVCVTARQIFYILPSQVHSRIKANKAAGWFLAIDTSLISPEWREIFERRPNLPSACDLNNYELTQYSKLLDLLCSEYLDRQGDKYYLQIIHALVQAFLVMAASTFNAVTSTRNKNNRAAELVRQFQDVLTANSRAIKSPAVYASMLNVSLGYLNEAVKKVTGSTVSYWIQQEIFSEAKRLLYHSDNDVKQIAYELGYADHSYFCRAFRKAAGVSPLRFRMDSRGE